jgi:hypothetical protein
VGFHHERVDPLYRTVAGAVRADVESDGVDVQAALGAVALHGTVRNLHDNLGHVASILTTRTRLRGGAVTLPLGSVFTRASWLPMLGYDIARTEQVGEGIPPNSEFTATHVPDQLSDNRNLSVQWQRAWWQIAYRLNLTHQDNRQSGRERADFTSAVHNLTLSLVGTRVNATVDLGMDGNDREESSEHSRTQRLGGTVDWHLTGSTTLTGGFTRTIVDHADTTVQRVSDGRVVIAQQLPLLRLSARSSPGQLFVRFSRQDETLGGGLAAALDRHTWYVSTGLTLGVF